jgi:hypothetical protein
MCWTSTLNLPTRPFTPAFEKYLDWSYPVNTIPTGYISRGERRRPHRVASCRRRERVRLACSLIFLVHHASRTAFHGVSALHVPPCFTTLLTCVPNGLCLASSVVRRVLYMVCHSLLCHSAYVSAWLVRPVQSCWMLALSSLHLLTACADDATCHTYRYAKVRRMLPTGSKRDSFDEAMEGIQALFKVSPSGHVYVATNVT